MNLSARLQEYLDDDLQRTRLTRAPTSDMQIEINGQRYINFCSNDYLGLSQHTDVKSAVIRGVEIYGFGSGASAYVTGYNAAQASCEAAFAEFLGYPRALLFGSGYLSNLGVLSTLGLEKFTVIHDQYNHASLIDGVKISAMKAKRYRHLNVEHAGERILSESNPPLIVTDGVFSMTGAIAPIAELQNLAHHYHGKLFVDDAHGFGVLGKTGRGIIESANTKPDLLSIPMGKAVGGYGGIVLGSDELIEPILQFARSAIYTTALPPCIPMGLEASLAVLIRETDRRVRLQNIIARTQTRLSKFLSDAHPTPIFCLPLRSNTQALAFESQLKKQGLLVRAMRYPTVPKDRPQLRLTVSALHTDAQLDSLYSAIEELYDAIS